MANENGQRSVIFVSIGAVAGNGGVAGAHRESGCGWPGLAAGVMAQPKAYQRKQLISGIEKWHRRYGIEIANVVSMALKMNGGNNNQ
jgi:hypothetical protein